MTADLRSALAGGAVTVVDALPAEPYRRRHLYRDGIEDWVAAGHPLESSGA